MSDSQACCAHCRVVLKHNDHPDGTRSDYWECDYGCGQRFAPLIQTLVGGIDNATAENNAQPSPETATPRTDHAAWKVGGNMYE